MNVLACTANNNTYKVFQSREVRLVCFVCFQTMPFHRRGHREGRIQNAPPALPEGTFGDHSLESRGLFLSWYLRPQPRLCRCVTVTRQNGVWGVRPQLRAAGFRGRTGPGCGYRGTVFLRKIFLSFNLEIWGQGSASSQELDTFEGLGDQGKELYCIFAIFLQLHKFHLIRFYLQMMY